MSVNCHTCEIVFVRHTHVTGVVVLSVSTMMFVRTSHSVSHSLWDA